MEKYGFVYLWFDRKHKRYYIGCRWGNENDGYVCSSSWMKSNYASRPKDFKRKILKTNIASRKETYLEEQRWLNLIKYSEIKPNNPNPRYYNLNIRVNEVWHKYEETIKTVGQKISAAKKGKSNGKHTEETKRKISETKKSRKIQFTDEHRAKLRAAKLGKNASPKTKEKMSASQKNAWKKGNRNRAIEKVSMSREEQNAKSSTRLKELWSDPVWKANQQQKLKEAASKKREMYK